MARRPGVEHASWPIATADLVGLAGQMAVALFRVPFRRPWDGEGDLPHNLAVALTRETLRTFMGYSSSLPIDEFRSVELVLDELCGVVLPPIVRTLEVTQEASEVAGVPGTWFRPRSGASGGTMVYLHGGGYIGTSPKMYSVFAAWLARMTGCEVFVADLRLAPEFPFPASLEDAVLVLEALITGGVDPARVVVAGDSSGGGLATSLVYSMVNTRHRPVGGVVLFSPEVSLRLDQPSVAANADRDILPWNIPTTSYLHGVDPASPAVSAVDQDPRGWPPTFVSFGSDEVLCDAIREFVAHLETAGVPTVALEEPGMFHVFPILMPWAEGSRRTYRAVGEFVRGLLAQAPGGDR